MRDGGARLGGFDTSRRDLQGCAWQAGMLLQGGLVACHGNGENGFFGHALSSLSIELALPSRGLLKHLCLRLKHMFIPSADDFD